MEKKIIFPCFITDSSIKIRRNKSKSHYEEYVNGKEDFRQHMRSIICLMKILLLLFCMLILSEKLNNENNPFNIALPCSSYSVHFIFILRHK